MEYAVLVPVAANVAADAEWVARFAGHVEACGFDEVVVVEHAVVTSRYGSVYPYAASGRMELADDCVIPDPLDLLTFLAARTPPSGSRPVSWSCRIITL